MVWHDPTIQPDKCTDTGPAFPGDPQYPYVGKLVHDLTQAQLQALNCGRLLSGFPAAEVVARLTLADEGAAQRQLHVLPALGPGAVHTGSACVPWCGHLQRGELSVAGNMLAGPQVISETVRTMRERADLPLFIYENLLTPIPYTRYTPAIASPPASETSLRLI